MIVATARLREATGRGPIQETVAGSLTPEVFLKMVPVMYPVHSTQYTELYLQFVGSTINNARKSTPGSVAWSTGMSSSL